MLTDSRLHVITQTTTISQLAALLKHCQLHLQVPDEGSCILLSRLACPRCRFSVSKAPINRLCLLARIIRVIGPPCRCVDDRDSECERQNRGECFARIEPLRVARLVSDALEACRGLPRS